MKELHQRKLTLVLKISQNIPYFPLLPLSWDMTWGPRSAAGEALLHGQDVCVCFSAVTLVPLFAGTPLYISRTTQLNQNLVTQALRQDAQPSTRVHASKTCKPEETKGSGRWQRRNHILVSRTTRNNRKWRVIQTQLRCRVKEGTGLGLEMSQKLS